MGYRLWVGGGGKSERGSACGRVNRMDMFSESKFDVGGLGLWDEDEDIDDATRQE